MGNAERILEFLRAHLSEAYDDDELSNNLNVRPRQQVNQICRRLAAAGLIKRGVVNGKIRNSIGDDLQPPQMGRSGSSNPRIEVPTKHHVLTGKVRVVEIQEGVLESFMYNQYGILADEDELKTVGHEVLRQLGFQSTEIQISWGHERGSDIRAAGLPGHWRIEVKPEGASDQMAGNYFYNALGQLLSRMDDPQASYGLLLPAHRRYVGLIQRLPALVKQRLGLHFFLVRKNESGYEVGHLGNRSLA